MLKTKSFPWRSHYVAWFGPSAYLSSPLTSKKRVWCYWPHNGIRLLVRLSLITDNTLVFSFAKFKAKYFISSFPETSWARSFKSLIFLIVSSHHTCSDYVCVIRLVEGRKEKRGHMGKQTPHLEFCQLDYVFWGTTYLLGTVAIKDISIQHNGTHALPLLIKCNIHIM